MANSAQARKRARQNITRNTRCAAQRSVFRTHLKKVISAIDSGNQEDMKNSYQQAAAVFDSLARKGIINKNKIARQKSRLNKAIKAQQA